MVTEAAAAAGSAVRMEGNVAVLRMGLCRELKAVTDGDGDGGGRGKAGGEERSAGAQRKTGLQQSHFQLEVEVGEDGYTPN